MRQVFACATALALIAGASQAASSSDVPLQVTHHSEILKFSGDWSAVELGLPVVEETDTEAFMVAGKRSRGGGGRRGGASHKNRGGFNNGNERHRNRHGGDRDVDIDRDVNVDVDYDDNDNSGALVGAVVGIGVGVAIANSNDPDYVCEDNNQDGQCDYD
jgi:opacity protein-like surface antigen